MLTDIVRSLKMHGFENIILIGDSGGNVTGMKNVAEKLNAQWNGNPVVAHIPEYYDYNSVAKLLGPAWRHESGAGPPTASTTIRASR